jgi:hypothetical protein
LFERIQHGISWILRESEDVVVDSALLETFRQKEIKFFFVIDPIEISCFNY